MTSRIVLGVALAAGLALPLGAAPVLAAAPPVPQGEAHTSAAAVDARIARLRSELRITPAEMPQWQTLAAVMRENDAGMHGLFEQRAAEARTMNAVQILQWYREFVHMHADDLDRAVPAFTNLYNVLSPEQRATADQLLRSRLVEAQNVQ